MSTGRTTNEHRAPWHSAKRRLIAHRVPGRRRHRVGKDPRHRGSRPRGPADGVRVDQPGPDQARAVEIPSLRPPGVGRWWIHERLAKRAHRSDDGAAQRARHSCTRARLRPTDQATPGIRRHRRRGVRLRLQRHERPPTHRAEHHHRAARRAREDRCAEALHPRGALHRRLLHALLRAPVPAGGLRGRRHRPDRAGGESGVWRNVRSAHPRAGSDPDGQRTRPRRLQPLSWPR